MTNWIFNRFLIIYNFRYRESFFALVFMTFSKFEVDDITQYHGEHRKCNSRNFCTQKIYEKQYSMNCQLIIRILIMNAELFRYGTEFTQKCPGVIFSKEILQKVFSKLLTYYLDKQKTMNCRINVHRNI